MAQFGKFAYGPSIFWAAEWMGKRFKIVNLAVPFLFEYFIERCGKLAVVRFRSFGTGSADFVLMASFFVAVCCVRIVTGRLRANRGRYSKKTAFKGGRINIRSAKMIKHPTGPRSRSATISLIILFAELHLSLSD